MNDIDFSAARDALVDARRRSQRIAQIPPGWVPADLDASYRLQHAVAAALGTTRGWKVSALTEAAQRGVGVTCPIAAPLLSPWVLDAPATLAFSTLLAPKLECEFAFELAQDLPSREAAYTRAEVEAAIGALRIVIEVCDARVSPGGSVLLELADALNNGAFVIGPAHADWKRVDYADHAIVLRAHQADGTTRELARGNARPVLDGDPVGALVLMANFAPEVSGGLRAGQIVTTGTCTGAVPLNEAMDVEADFGTLGQVRIHFQ